MGRVRSASAVASVLQPLAAFQARARTAALNYRVGNSGTAPPSYTCNGSDAAMIRKALIIWAARLAAAQEHCHPHVPSEPQDARRISRYITQVYPVNSEKHASDAKQLKQAFEALHYFYAPTRNILEPARHLKTDSTPRLPYLPEGAYYACLLYTSPSPRD